MSDFLGFLGWVALIFLIFVLVVGFNRQMMEKNRIRDEQIAERKARKKESGESNENID